jgi:hypothetical protein
MGKISCTTDIWTNPFMTPYLGLTAHWIESKMERINNRSQIRLALRSELIGFKRLPGRHSGEHISQAILHIVNRLGFTEKVTMFILASTYFNMQTVWMAHL